MFSFSGLGETIIIPKFQPPNVTYERSETSLWERWDGTPLGYEADGEYSVTEPAVSSTNKKQSKAMPSEYSLDFIAGLVGGKSGLLSIA